MIRWFLLFAIVSTTAIANSPRPASTLTVLQAAMRSDVDIELNCKDSLEKKRCTVTIRAQAIQPNTPVELYVGGPGTSAIQVDKGTLTGSVLTGTKAVDQFCGAMMGTCPISRAAGLIAIVGKTGAAVIQIDVAYSAPSETDRSIAARRHPFVTGEKNTNLREGPLELVVQADRLHISLEPPPGGSAPGLNALPESCPSAPCHMILGIRSDVPFRPGGPLLGLGARIEDDQTARFIARIGYEIAAPKWLLIGIQTDTDFHHFASLAVTAEAAFGGWLYGTLGIGAVAELTPMLRSGLRINGGTGAYFGALVGSVDMFFVGDAIHYRGSVLLQAGF
ncbi:MAG: hypothetical protein VX223_03185 [Myxococcota bacterium]|nr:hypothetical protein [Myxococcota bacterium]